MVAINLFIVAVMPNRSIELITVAHVFRDLAVHHIDAHKTVPRRPLVKKMFKLDVPPSKRYSVEERRALRIKTCKNQVFSPIHKPQQIDPQNTFHFYKAFTA